MNSGHVRVYHNNSGAWIQVGEDIDGEAANDEFGKSISLSSDGSVVAVAAPLNDGSGEDSGHVRIYRNDSGTWAQVGGDIDGGFGGDLSASSISLNSDGSVVAIGSPGYDFITGYRWVAGVASDGTPTRTSVPVMVSILVS